ncbi:MAG: hypothetical protein MJ166_06360 [Clostridia bacterium]|nr:hypothetical protein [Clostridia bacterium]
MKTKKIIVLALTVAMAFIIAGCGSTTNKIDKVFHASDYEKIEEKDFKLSDMSHIAERGYYLTLTYEDNIEDLADSYSFDEDGVKSVLVGWNKGPNYTLDVKVFEFHNKDVTKDFYNHVTILFEHSINTWEAEGIEVESDEGDNFFQYALEFEDEASDHKASSYHALVIDDTTVSIIYVYDGDEDSDVVDDLDSICDALKIDSPTNLI